jgi:ABC-2 type transport system permease protein
VRLVRRTPGPAQPVGAALHYINAILVNGHGWTADLSYLVSPLIGAVVAGSALVVASTRIVRLTAGVGGA